MIATQFRLIADDCAGLFTGANGADIYYYLLHHEGMMKNVGGKTGRPEENVIFFVLSYTTRRLHSHTTPPPQRHCTPQHRGRDERPFSQPRAVCRSAECTPYLAHACRYLYLVLRTVFIGAISGARANANPLGRAWQVIAIDCHRTNATVSAIDGYQLSSAAIVRH